jgi:hypothetical protein
MNKYTFRISNFEQMTFRSLLTYYLRTKETVVVEAENEQVALSKLGNDHLKIGDKPPIVELVSHHAV